MRHHKELQPNSFFKAYLELRRPYLHLGTRTITFSSSEVGSVKSDWEIQRFKRQKWVCSAFLTSVFACADTSSAPASTKASRTS